MLVLAIAPPPAPPPQTVVCRWDFTKGLQGWMAGPTAPATSSRLGLTIRTQGRDPILIGPDVRLEPRAGDVLEVTIAASRDGDLQWFWRTTKTGPFGGFSQEDSVMVRAHASATPRAVRVRPFWPEGRPIIGLRFDLPEGAPGVYKIVSIRVLRTATGKPVAPTFAFGPGASGWTTETGEPASVTARGIVLDGRRNDARLVAPPMQIDPARHTWAIIDATASAASSPDGRVELAIEHARQGRRGFASTRVRLAPGRRSVTSVRLAGRPHWDGSVTYVALAPLRGAGSRTTIHAFRLAEAPAPPASGAASGFEVQTTPWAEEKRLPVSPARVDVARQAPPPTVPRTSDHTVAMWYFAAWEPEYTWDGWKQVAERSPWRLPLLYDSSDPEMEFSGIRFYRSSNPRVLDWHVHWMREHGVNLMLWDWYPHVDADGAFTPSFFGNRALEIGFLGKDRLGGPPVATNRFAETMPFAVMWTNHAPGNKIGKGMAAYIVEQFMLQPNYYRLDGKPLLALWDPRELVGASGGEAQARAVLDDIRAKAQAAGLPGVYVAAVNALDTRAQARALGIDGVMAYNYIMTGGFRSEHRALGDRAFEDRFEDFAAQTLAGHEQTWKRMADEFGRDYLLATMPMQNWEPTFRSPSYVVHSGDPDAYREMLRRARAFIAARNLRPFVSVEAWNEWLEGSYVEPSTQWGFGYLEALRDTFAAPPPGP